MKYYQISGFKYLLSFHQKELLLILSNDTINLFKQLIINTLINKINLNDSKQKNLQLKSQVFLYKS